MRDLVATVVMMVLVLVTAVPARAEDNTALAVRTLNQVEYWKAVEPYGLALLLEGDIDGMASIVYTKVERLAVTNFVAAKNLAHAHAMTAETFGREHWSKAAHFYHQAASLACTEDEQKAMETRGLICKLLGCQ